MNKTKILYEFYYQPGLYWTRDLLDRHVGEMRDVAKLCLSEVPDYQCLSGNRKTLARNVIVQARSKQTKELIGFCSAILFKLNDKENVLHLGLTCVSPEYRGLGLTHKLTSKLLRGYFLEHSLLKTHWISNVACVLSSLGNVAKYFDNVYPSPFMAYPSKKHFKIAKMISGNSLYKKDIYIDEHIKFNPVSFVFEGSVYGNTFQKSEQDEKYFHRDVFINNYYRQMLDFEKGDEVLQIGKVNILTFVKYFIKSWFKVKINLNDFFDKDEVLGVASELEQ